MKRKEAKWEFLWVSKRKLLWGVVFGLMMALPGISGAQMKADVNLVVSTVDGVTRVNTLYTSEFAGRQIQGVQQNQYVNNVIGFGGPTTVGVEFLTNGNSEISFAGLSILKQNPDKSKTTEYLTAMEKIGTGNEDLRASFAAAGGSEIRVSETEHATQASTLGGNLVYQVQSSGVGSMEAGVVGKFCTECVKCEEPSKKGGMEDLRLQAGMLVQQAQGNLMTGFQRVEAHVEFSGRYSGIFQAIVGPSK